MSGGWKNSIGERWITRAYSDHASSSESAAVVEDRLFVSTTNVSAIVTAVALSISIAGSTPTAISGQAPQPAVQNVVVSGTSPTLSVGKVVNGVSVDTAIGGGTPYTWLGTAVTPTSNSVTINGQTPVVIRTINITPGSSLSVTVGGAVSSITYGNKVDSLSANVGIDGGFPELHLGWVGQAGSSNYSIGSATPSYSTGHFAHPLGPYNAVLGYSTPSYICGEVVSSIQNAALVEGSIPVVAAGTNYGPPTINNVVFTGDTPVASAGAILNPTSNTTTLGYSTPTHTVVTVQAVVITDVSSLTVSVGSNSVIASAGATGTPVSKNIVTSGKYPEVVYTSIFSEHLLFDVSITGFNSISAELTSSYNSVLEITTTLGNAAVQLTPEVSTPVEVTQALSVSTSITANIPLTTEI